MPKVILEQIRNQNDFPGLREEFSGKKSQNPTFDFDKLLMQSFESTNNNLTFFISV